MPCTELVCGTGIDLNYPVPVNVGNPWPPTNPLTIEEIIRELTGLIDEGLLATTLREKINRITGLDVSIAQQGLDIISRDFYLQQILSEVRSTADRALTYVGTETVERTTADSGLVNRYNAIAAGLAGALAAITEEERVRVGANLSMALRIDNLFTTTGVGTAAIRHEQEVLVEADRLIGMDITTLVGRTGKTEAAIVNNNTFYADRNIVYVNNSLDLYGKIGNAEAAIKNINNLALDSDSSLAKSIKTMESALFDKVAQVEVSMSTWITGTQAFAGTAEQLAIKAVAAVVARDAIQAHAAIPAVYSTSGLLLSPAIPAVTYKPAVAAVAEVIGRPYVPAMPARSAVVGAITKVRDMGALYTVKLNVNGLIGGYGMYNDGSTVEAGFDVDTFWVGRTNANGIKPFIITDNKVYINSAFISKLSADQIDTRGLTIKNEAGTIIFSSGTPLAIENVVGLSAFLNTTYPQDNLELQNQIDGKVESWFQSSDPADNWTTAAIKTQHTGDMWWNASTKVLQRYSGTGWSGTITDPLAVSAFYAAGKAQSTADGKMVVFTIQPSNYDIGDLWDAGGIPRILKRATTASASFNASHWVVVANETTNTNQLTDGANLGSTANWTNVTGRPTTLAALDNAAATQLDKKSVTYYKTTAPSGLGTKDNGDIWFDTDNSYKMYSWTGSAWQAVQDSAAASLAASNALNAASDALTAADSKITTFYDTSIPTATATGDLWYNAYTKLLKRWTGSSWVIVSNAYTNSSELTDGAGWSTTATWNGIPVGTGKPEDYATKGATFGSNITLSTGQSVGATDFVHKLSKISAPNGANPLSNFMDNLAIGNAYIGNAAVSTLKIQGHAVSVIVSGAASATITLSSTADIFVIVTTNFYGATANPTTTRLKADVILPSGSKTSLGDSGAAIAFGLGICLTVGASCPQWGAGQYTFLATASCSVGSATVGNQTVTVIATYR